MGCDTLLQLLNREGWTAGKESPVCASIATHIQTCPECMHGMIRLSGALLTVDMLTCKQCHTYFPAYYEATRPQFPLVSLDDQEIAAVVLHMGYCAACSEEYEELVQLSELEERGELLS